MKRRPTVRTVAEMTGLSHTTVSLALRNHPRISEATRRKVVEAADRLEYRPDPAVANVMSRLRFHRDGGHVIAFVTRYGDVDWKRHPVYGRTTGAMFERAETLGYKLEVFPYDSTRASGKRLSEILYHRGIRGIIFSGSPRGISHITMDLEHFSSVIMGHSVVRPQLHRVASHHFHTAITALRRLQRTGSRRIGFIVPRRLNLRLDNMLLGAFLTFQANVPKASAVPPLLPESADFPSFKKWFAKHRPDGIAYLADGVPGFVRALGLEIPGDVQLANMDLRPGDLESGFDQCYEAAGVIMVDTLVSRMFLNETGVPMHPSTLLLEGKWVDGYSTRKMT